MLLIDPDILKLWESQKRAHLLQTICDRTGCYVMLIRAHPSLSELKQFLAHYGIDYDCVVGKIDPNDDRGVSNWFRRYGNRIVDFAF